MILYKFIYLLFFIEYFKYLTFIYSLKSKFNALSIIAIYEKYSMFFFYHNCVFKATIILNIVQFVISLTTNICYQYEWARNVEVIMLAIKSSIICIKRARYHRRNYAAVRDKFFPISCNLVER